MAVDTAEGVITRCEFLRFAQDYSPTQQKDNSGKRDLTKEGNAQIKIERENYSLMIAIVLLTLLLFEIIVAL